MTLFNFYYFNISVLRTSNGVACHPLKFKTSFAQIHSFTQIKKKDKSVLHQLGKENGINKKEKDGITQNYTKNNSQSDKIFHGMENARP